MKYRDRLKVGDWIFEGRKSEIVKGGKFRIARVSGIVFDNWEELDLTNQKIEILGSEGILKGEKGFAQVLNDKELKNIQVLRTKLKILNNLDDGNKIKKR